MKGNCEVGFVNHDFQSVHLRFVNSLINYELQLFLLVVALVSVGLGWARLGYVRLGWARLG